MSSYGWLREMAATVPFACVEKARPRHWVIGVPFQWVAVDWAVQVGRLGYEVIEPEDFTDDRARHEQTTMRFRQARHRLVLDVEDVLMSGRFNRNPYRLLLPPGMPFVRPRPRDPRIEREFVKTCEVISPDPDGPQPFRWAIKHRATGCTVFFDLTGPAPLVSAAEYRRVASGALDELVLAVEERVRRASNRRGDPHAS